MKLLRTKKLILGLATLLVVLGFGVSVVYAQDNFGVDQGSFSGVLQSPGGDLRDGIKLVMQWLLSFLGIVAVLVILYGGYIWMTAGGEEKKVEKAKKILIGGIIGLVIILTSFAIVTMVFNIFYPPCPDGNCPPPTESCISGETRSCSTTNCNGTQVCTDSEVWGSCVPTGFCPASSEQATWIWQLESTLLGKKRFGHTVSRTICVPNEALTLTAYARNKGGSIANVILEQAVGVTNPAFTQYSNSFNPSATSDSEFYPTLTWDTSTYEVGSLWWLRTKVTRSTGEDFTSSILTTKVAPDHCFNGIKDANETAVDFGAGCDCGRFPEITSITPDNGATGNYVTIAGRYFGGEAGYVELRGTNSTEITAFNLPAMCGSDGWRDYQIIFEVPNLAQEKYEVTVCNTENLCSSEDVSFTINDTVRPGICNVTNTTNPLLNAPPQDVVAGSSTQVMGLFGNQFPLSGTQNVVWNFRPYNVTSTVATFSTADSGRDVVPENRRGHSSISVFNGTQYSNPYTINVGEGDIGDSCGNGDTAICAAASDCSSGLMCDPNQACTCQPAPSICNDNILGPAEDCELIDTDPTDQVPGTYQFKNNSNLCSSVGLGNGQLSCNECKLNTQQCEFDPFARKASQSIYAWSFLASEGGLFPDLKIVEECDRTQTCRDGQRLPSPTPWFEGDGAGNGGWNASTTYSYIAEPRVCINAIIGARFTTNVATSTINPSTVFVLECASKEGTDCDRRMIPYTSSNFIVSGDNNGANSLFQLIPANKLLPNKWYKVLLTDGITSDANKPLSSLSEAELVKRSCLGITYGDQGTAVPNNIAYCWNFQTRASEQLCAVGCINCSPDPTRSSYANNLHIQTATPDSADNVCLSLNPALYSWTWTEKEFSKTPIIEDKKDTYLNPRNWIPGPVRSLVRKSELANINLFFTVSSARLETIYDTPEYVRLEAKENISGNSGYCKAINDFTNPVVMEDRECRAGTTQSPTPWKGSTDACINAMISARFSRPMVDSSIRLYGSQPSVAIETCTATDPDACVWNRLTQTELRDQGPDTDPEVVVFDYSHPISENQLPGSVVDNNQQGPLPEGFYVKNFTLAANTWYRVIIFGGDSGVRGSRIINKGTEKNPVMEEVEEAQGILLTPTISPSKDFNGDLYDDYYYAFKTANSDTPCAVDSVNVSPFQKFMRYIGENQMYSAFPQAENCNLLNPDSYSYQWRSLLDLGDDTTKTESQLDQETASNNFGSGSSVGMIAALVDRPLSSAQVMVTGIAEGFTNVVARIKNTRPAGSLDWKQDKIGHGELTVGLGELMVNSHSPKGIAQCTTDKVSVNFSLPVKTSSLRYTDKGGALQDNIQLYKCAQDDLNCSIVANNRVPLLGLYPVGYNQPPEFTRTVIASSTSMLATSTTYRAIIRGGANGVIAWNNKQLAELNYRSSNGTGEECEASALNICSSTCLLKPTANVCGSEFEECQSSIYYPLNGNVNSADSRYNGTIAGTVSFAEGRIGQGAVFDGAHANGVTLPANQLDANQGTISAWIKPNAINANGHVLYFHRSSWNSGNDGFGGPEMHLTLTQNKEFVFYYGSYSADDSTNYELKSGVSYEVGKWYHIAGTYKNGDAITLYINGEEVGQMPITKPAVLGPAWNSMWYYGAIGRAQQTGPTAGDTRAFNGVIDEVKLYNRVLSANDIAKLAKLTTEEAANPYCSAFCQNLGNSNIASCGNKAIERGEDCDDGNTANGDRCSARCLWEGSTLDRSAGSGAVCGNDRIDYGEQCEDGNLINGDGCNDRCLYEPNYHSKFNFGNNGFADGIISTTSISVSGKNIVLTEACDNFSANSSSDGCDNNFLNIGANANVSVCGNTKIEAGEDCDDGNTQNGDSCSATCLNEGSPNFVEPGKAMCGNGIVENGQNDSYSWTFTMAPDARACNDVSIDGNPCPNGIRQIIFGKDVTNASITSQYGSDNDVGGGSCVAANANASFWRKAVERVKRVVRQLVGIEVTAAQYWCAETNAVQFNASDFETMTHQTVVKSIIKGSETIGEVIGYQNENGERVVNFIRDADWSANTEYRFKVDYELFGVEQEVATTATRAVMTLGQVCPIEKVKVNIWPAGEEKYSDTFFCAGDNCGRATADDPYDDDQDLETSGNQHMYRAWAMGRGGNALYPVRADSFIWDMKNIPTADASNKGVNELGYGGSYASTDYQGDQWVTGSRTSGDSELAVRATSASTGDASATIAIRTFICANPWPTPQNFPYRDNGNNCKVDGSTGGNVCINTNFETYYCRDAGGPGSEDDLPILGEYLSDGSLRTTIRGLEQDKVNNFSLIKEFLLPRGQAYTDYVFGRVPQMRTSTESVTGKVKEALQFNSARYSQVVLREPLKISARGGTIALWAKPSAQTDGGAMMRIDGTASGGSSYVIVRTVNAATTGMVKFQMTYGDAGSKKYTILESAREYPVDQWHHVASAFDANKLALYVNGVEDASSTSFTSYSDDWDQLYIGRGYYSLDSPPGNSHYTGALDEIRLYDRALSPVEIVSLLTPTPATTIAGHLVGYYPFNKTSNDAIGIRVAGNPTHRSPSVWYQLAFAENKKETQGSLVDGYQSLSDGRTVYVNVADLNDVGNRIFGMMYIMSYTDGAEDWTQNIYKQLVANWKFNVADADNQGGLREFGYCSIRSTKTCSRSSECADQGIYSSCISGQCSVACYSDSTCSASSNGICISDKAKVTRDTKRLADAGDAQAAIDKYVAVKRCSTDHNRLCSDDSQCFGGGVCGNFAPELKSGTYIVNRTFSVWPSWQQTLSKTLGAVMPTDPLNRLIGCTNPYDPTTCWDNANSRMKCPTDGWLYTYYAYNGGRTYGFYAHAEYSPAGVIWDTTQQRTFSLFSIGQLCRDDQNGLCGNKQLDVGEDCNNCPLDSTCGSGQTCQRITNSTAWQCVARSKTPVGNIAPVCSDTGDADGDGVLNCLDRCPNVADPTNPNTQCPGDDTDGDGRENNVDNCPNVYNPDQSNVDGDAEGDMCDVCYKVDGQCLQLKMTDSDNSAVNITILPYVSNKTAAQFYNLGSANGIARSGVLTGSNGSIFAYYDTTNKILSLGAALTYDGYNSTPLGFKKLSGDFPSISPVGIVRDDQSDAFQFSSAGASFSWSKASGADLIDGVLVPIGDLSKKWSIQVDGRTGTPPWYVVGPGMTPRATTQKPVISYGPVDVSSYICGDGKKEGSEVCDCGDSTFDYIFATGNRTVEGRTWLCLSNNNQKPLNKPYYLTARSYYWCGVEGQSATACTTLQSAMSDWCGDGVLTSAYEECDASAPTSTRGYAIDTNYEKSSTTNQYQCSPKTCQDVGGYCGDGIRQANTATGVALEACDDGNTDANDGCFKNDVGMCVKDSAYTCTEDASGRSTCVARCGNGINDDGPNGGVSPSTKCDDGNRNNGDGCSDSCDIEDRFTCDRPNGDAGSSACKPVPIVSGDGLCEYARGENWDNEPSCAVYDGATVSLKWDDAKFLSVNKGCDLCGDEGINANRDVVNGWEKFKIELVGNTVAGKVINNGDLVQFTSLKNNNGVKFESGDPNYLHARSGGDARFKAVVELQGGYDSLRRGTQFYLKATNGKYFDIKADENHSPAHLGSANTLVLYDDSGDAQVALNNSSLSQVAGVSEQAEIVGRSVKSWYYGFISSLTSVWKLIGSWVVTH